MTVDEFEEYGMFRMDDDDIQQTLSNEQIGILGLPTESAPCLRPLSYWYDGDSRLYFVYVLGSDSRKVALSEHADAARFLVYKVYTPFNWRSVLLTGTIERVPEDERAAIEGELDLSWRPELFEQDPSPVNVGLYRFEITDRSGIKQLERQLEFGADSSPADKE